MALPVTPTDPWSSIEVIKEFLQSPHEFPQGPNVTSAPISFPNKSPKASWIKEFNKPVEDEDEVVPKTDFTQCLTYSESFAEKSKDNTMNRWRETCRAGSPPGWERGQSYCNLHFNMDNPETTSYELRVILEAGDVIGRLRRCGRFPWGGERTNGVGGDQGWDNSDSWTSIPQEVDSRQAKLRALSNCLTAERLPGLKGEPKEKKTKWTAKVHFTSGMGRSLYHGLKDSLVRDGEDQNQRSDWMARLLPKPRALGHKPGELRLGSLTPPGGEVATLPAAAAANSTAAASEMDFKSLVTTIILARRGKEARFPKIQNLLDDGSGRDESGRNRGAYLADSFSGALRVQPWTKMTSPYLLTLSLRCFVTIWQPEAMLATDDGLRTFTASCTTRSLPTASKWRRLEKPHRGVGGVRRDSTS
ncbi:hypothetical protein MMC07_003380 [Pseudocyphellaria aurata]|nr:hypothetical protein [Pseudocyphellaria aurata]